MIKPKTSSSKNDKEENNQAENGKDQSKKRSLSDMDNHDSRLNFVLYYDTFIYLILILFIITSSVQTVNFNAGIPIHVPVTNRRFYTALSEEMRSDLSKMTSLRISDFILTYGSIDYSFFNYYINLNWLILNRTKIKTISPNIFKSLLNLKKLDLTSNEIVSIIDSSFSNLVNLDELIITSNKLGVIFSSTFSGLISLKCLFLDDNRIFRIYNNSFIHMPI